MQVKPTIPNVLYVVFRHRSAIIWTFVVIFGLTVAYCLLGPQLYEVESNLYVKFGHDAGAPSDTSSGAGQANDALGQATVLVSLEALITSENLVGQVINEIGVDKLYPSIAKLPPWLYWWGTPFNSALRKMIDHDLTVSTSKRRTSSRSSTSTRTRSSPPGVRLVVDKFVAKRAFAAARSAIDFPRGAAGAVQEAARRRRGRSQALPRPTKISSIDEERTLLLKQRSDLEANLDVNQSQVDQLERQMQVLQAELTKLPPLVDVADQDDAAQTQLTQLQVQRQALLNNYRPDSVTVRNVEKQITELQQLVAQGHTKVGKQVPNGSHQQIEVNVDQDRAQLDGLRQARRR